MTNTNKEYQEIKNEISTISKIDKAKRKQEVNL